MAMAASPGTQFIQSFLFLRRWIGIVGVALPFVLIGGVALLSGQLLSSISASYHSDLRNVFVGGMCAVGVFLILYRGIGLWENLATNVAGAAGILLALFPTRPANAPTDAQKIIGGFHIGFSVVFFVLLGVICFFLFPRPEPGSLDDPARKQLRNRIYRTCGILIAVSLLGILVLGCVFESQTRSVHPVLWLEALAIFAFGTAWLIKGKTLFANRVPKE